MVDQKKVQIELLRRAAWDDLYIFTKYVCGKDLLEEQPHREVCEFLTAGLENSEYLNLNFNPVYKTLTADTWKKVLKKLLMLNRGAFKSTIASTSYPLWLLWHNPNLRIMLDCATLSNAKAYLYAIKDQIVNNEILKKICVDSEGNYLLEPNYKVSGGFTEDQLILKHRTKIGLKEPSILLTAVDNAKTGFHPDIIIMDDLVSEKTVETDGQIEKTKDHYKYSLSLLEKGGFQLVIGTRYHMNDLYADLLELDIFDSMVRPAILEDGSLYFPSRFTHEYLAELKATQGSYIFSCQYMLNPIDDSHAIFKKEYMSYYTEAKDIKEVHILCDPAISQKETADFTVIIAVGVDANKNLFVLEYDRGHYLPNRIIQGLITMYLKYRDEYRVNTVGLETVAYQKALLYLLQDECRNKQIYMPIKELRADKDKIRRVQALQPLYERGEIKIKRDMIDLEREILEFPLSKHDDAIDALAYILQALKPGKRNLKKRSDPKVKRNSRTNY